LPTYKHYRSFVKTTDPENLSEKIHFPVSKFLCQLAYSNVTNWEERINLVLEWRSLAEKYSNLNVTIWQFNSMFVDQMLSLKPLALHTIFISLVCMMIICAIFIQNPITVIVSVVAIGSISIGVIGYLSFWELHLDPVTLCAVLMSIGMCVDFTAHISYMFQLDEKRKVLPTNEISIIPLLNSKLKLSNTLQSVAWPMIQAGLSTMVCVTPLIFLQNYIPLVFVKTVTLVVILGLFHGLVLMPAFLSLVPAQWLKLNCWNAFGECLKRKYEARQGNFS